MTLSDADIRIQLATIGGLADGELPIAETALWLAHRDVPDARIDGYFDHINTLAEHVASAARGVDSLRDRVAALRDVIFRYHGYKGDADTYDDMQNANLMCVIDRRRGLPVALGILVIDAARAQGWDVRGLNFPGHFLLRMSHEGEHVTVDPFNRLRRLAADELSTILTGVHGRGIPLKPEFIRSVSDRDVLLRLQNNIKARALNAGETTRAIDVLESMVLIAPDNIALLEELVTLEVQEGRVRTAVERVKERLAEGGAKADAVAALYARLRGTLH